MEKDNLKSRKTIGNLMVIMLLNIILVMVFTAAVYAVYAKHYGSPGMQGWFETWDPTIKLVYPVLSILIPLMIIRLYPESRKSMAKKSEGTTFSSRMNAVGMLTYSLTLNILFYTSFAWRICWFTSIFIAYILALILPLRPVFESMINPPGKWSARELSYKIALLFFSLFVIKAFWGKIEIPSPLLLYTGLGRIYDSLLAFTALIFFYISFSLAMLPSAERTKTHDFDNIELERVFKK
jgi:hypothetical protein